MAKCKDCIHEKVCVWNAELEQACNEDCSDFKNKADFAEVKHGEWLPDYETFVDEWERESEPIQTGWVCSLCGRQAFNQEPYCHCGAKMDGGKGDDNEQI